MRPFSNIMLAKKLKIIEKSNKNKDNKQLRQQDIVQRIYNKENGLITINSYHQKQ